MITLSGFGKSYKKPVFSQVDISFPSNEVNFIMGKNGCGKTTLFKCISSLERYNGEISFDGKSIKEIRNDIFILWDDTPFYAKLSGIDNVMLFSEGKIKRNDVFDIASQYIDCNLLKRHVKTYSYGQKKKLSLILLEILKPRFILMDEISNGLDVETMRTLANKINEFKINSTIILTGHQFSFYQHIAENVYVKKGTQLVKIDYDKNEEKQLELIYHEELS